MNKKSFENALTLQDLDQIRHFNEVKFDRKGSKLYYLESINGQGSIFQSEPDDKPLKISGDFNVRGTVGYGGGEFDVGSSKLAFTEKSGRLYRVDLQQGNAIKPITPVQDGAAAPAISADEQWVLYVYQQEDTNGLAIARMHELTQPGQLVLGADFYMQPVWHPSGEMIAWAEYDHPNMPWMASRVKIGKVGGMQIHLQEESWIDGSEGFAASQPHFSPDGKWLSYIRREENWDSLVLYDIENHEKHTLLPPDGCHLCLPNWVQGMRSYAWCGEGQDIIYFSYLRGRTTLWKVNLRSGRSEPIDISPVRRGTQIDVSMQDDRPAFLGISTKQPVQVWLVSSQKTTAVVKNDTVHWDEKAITEPQEIIFQSEDHTDIFGIYYPPGILSRQKDGLPPLILDIHSGPTDQDSLCFSSKAAYFTTRGYAYALINYRGSSGFGYDYMEALRHSWGIVDVEDTQKFAQELVKRGLADPVRLVLRGSSAGGFTALNALIQSPGLFRAAICSYAVSNLVEDAENTHKFERFYHRFLTGSLENDYQRFIDRSPIFHIDKINDPIALFHGDSDKVVSVQQSIEIYEKLSKRGVPCILKIYEGEGHGFRKAETIQDYYQRVEEFLEEHLAD